MEHTVCQSCGFVLVEENLGTNRDQSLNVDYCKHCFKNGGFIDPSLTLHEFEIKILEMAEEHNAITLEEAQQIVRDLPNLKRWQLLGN